jgi:hypothetical protein
VRNRLMRVFSLLVWAFLVGCAVETPAARSFLPGEVATVSFSRGAPQIDIRSILLDGSSVSSSLDSVQVAPGAHTVSLVYVLTATDMCDGLDETCPTTTVRGSCNGEFTLTPAEQSVVALDMMTGGVRAFVRPPWKFSDLFADVTAPKTQLACQATSSTAGATRGAM